MEVSDSIIEKSVSARNCLALVHLHYVAVALFSYLYTVIFPETIDAITTF